MKKLGNLDAAIAKLREAYAAMATTNFTYDVKPFLRLPMYLQEAGRSDEGWKELNNLLLGFPNQLPNNKLIPMTHSIIYDQMRLFLQREKKVEEAVLFSMFSYLCWIKGLCLQSRKREIKECLMRKAIEQAMEPAIQTARMANLASQLVGIVAGEAARAPHIDLRRVEEEFKIIKKNAEIPPEIRSYAEQACERTGSSAGEFRCFLLIRALNWHPKRGSQVPVAPLERYPEIAYAQR